MKTLLLLLLAFPLLMPIGFAAPAAAAPTTKAKREICAVSADATVADTNEDEQLEGETGVDADSTVENFLQDASDCPDGKRLCRVGGGCRGCTARWRCVPKSKPCPPKPR